jgi:glycosyltransferase involved in cell wall biosynthesis
LDEEELVASVVARLVAALEQDGVPFRLVLVDNGSRDRTGELVDGLAADTRIEALHLSPNAGYGGGILAGLQWLAAQPDVDVLGWAWGDGQVDPAALVPLYEACRSGAQLAKARRTVRDDGRRRRMLTAAYSSVMRVFGVATPDVNGCPKLLRREAYTSLAPRSSDWFIDAEVVLGTEARAWRIVEVAVVMEPRQGGQSKVKLATVAEFALNLVRWRWRDRGRSRAD